MTLDIAIQRNSADAHDEAKSVVLSATFMQTRDFEGSSCCKREAQATVTHGKANHNFDRTLAEAREDGEAVLSTTKRKALDFRSSG